MLNPIWYIPIHEYKLIYFQIPKCANTSVIFSLGQITNWDNFPKMEKFDFSKHHQIQESVRRYKKPFTPAVLEQYHDYFKFTFVRNPWDRAVSCWYDKVKNKKDWFVAFSRWGLDKRDISFEKYCERILSIKDMDSNDHFRSQSFCVGQSGELFLDWYGKVESANEDWSFLQEHVLNNYNENLPDLNIVNRIDRAHYSFYYTDYTRGLISTRYKDDVKAFDYSFGESQ